MEVLFGLVIVFLGIILIPMLLLKMCLHTGTNKGLIEDLEQRRREELMRVVEIAQIDTMDGVDFENYVARLLQDRGFRTQITKRSGDLGVDIIATQNGTKYAVQCKRQSKNVSRRAVSDAVTGKVHYKCERAMVVTNSWFTKRANDLSLSTDCELVDRDKLTKWILDFQNRSTIGA